MAEGLLVRTSASADLAAIEALYPEAFPEENLIPLVRELLGETAVAQSLVSVVDGRFGFQADASVEPPYPLPAEWAGAWQSKPLSGSVQTCAGTLSVPAPWRHPELWAD